MKTIKLFLLSTLLIVSLTACQKKVKIEQNPPATIQDILAGDSQSAKYMDYDQARAHQARKDGERVILFFTANNCRQCEESEESIIKNIMELPTDIQIFRVNFNSDDEIVEEYQIDEAGYFIQLNHANQIVAKWQYGDSDILLEELTD